MMDTIIRAGTHSKSQRGQTLTERELVVAQLVSKDLSNKQIADELGLSPHTVKFHILNISIKLNVKTRVGIAVWVCLQP